MSTAVLNIGQALQRKNTNGHSSVPNSVIENQALLTHAELALLLAVTRRGDGCTISDENWSKWTGLKARQKEYAITGLRDKGLTIQGRGAKARYSVSWSTWKKFVTHATPPEIIKPRTKGRGVKAPPNMKVHEDCAENGCLKLCDECDTIAQPVARLGTDERADMHRAASGGSLVDIGPPSALGVTIGPRKIAQPVARSGRNKNAGRMAIAQPVAQTPASYPLLFAALQRRFPTVTPSFLVRLLDRVRSTCQTIPDDRDLARLLQAATKRTQHSEGLYLETFPAVCGAWLIESSASRVKVASQKISFSKVIEGLEKLIDRRFREVSKSTIRALNDRDWSTVPKAQFVTVVEEIARPLTAVCLRVYSESPEYPKRLAALNKSSESLGLSDADLADHVKTHLEMSAYEFCEVPYIWPSSNPFPD